MSEKSWDNAFRLCPGAWYGNMPLTPDGTRGNMVIDVTSVQDAILFLHRRGLRAVDSRIHDGGIALMLEATR